MEEKKALKRNLIRHTIYNLIAFSCIMLFFGVFVFAMVRSITYRNVDKTLLENMSSLKELDSQVKNFLNLPSDLKDNENDVLNKEIRGYKDYILTQKIKNPKIILVLRNEKKEIINEDELGRFGDYIEKLNNYDTVLNKIYNLKIENTYNYRAINFKIDADENSQERYVQLFINVDSEQELMKNYGEIISYAVAFGIILSILASYVLSKRTLKPIEENIMKQTEFVQNVSHELRTPLTIIQAKQELLLQEPNAKIIDKSEEIMLTLNETKRLTKLIKDLMILSRADNKTLNLQKESVNLDQFIENLAKPYIEIAEMQGKEMKLNLNCNADIKIDTNRIYQLLIILLDNAIKYTEEKDTIEIQTNCKENKCIIEVKDTGIGVSDEGLNRIFERFYREDKARNRETGGSGLGLSIASFIVSAHGGTIKATHNEPKGTIFTIRLPK